MTGIYTLWAPFYDRALERVFREPRRRAIQLLNLGPGNRLLIVGIGTGLDIPYLPEDILVTGIDLNTQMLARARSKSRGRQIDFQRMDAQALDLDSEHFDAVLCNLVLSVAPNGKAAFDEAWRVLKPGGCLVIFDKFLPEGERLSVLRRLLGFVLTYLGTDPNRRLTQIVGETAVKAIVLDEASLLRGQYRVIKLVKPQAQRQTSNANQVDKLEVAIATE